MMKRVLSIVLALVMLLSLNAFALSNSDVTHNDVKIIGTGAGVEVVFTKSGSTLTARAYLVGELNNMTSVNVGFKANNTYLTITTNDVLLSDEFRALVPTWNCDTKKFTANSSGYNYAAYHTNATTADGYAAIPAGSRMLFATMNYTIADGLNVTSENIGDMIAFNATFRAQSKIVFNGNKDVTSDTNPEVFTFNTSGLDSYNLSINTPANGVATLADTVVAGGQSTTITVTPAVGYYISSVMAGEANITSSFDAYRGGSAQYTPTASTAITVTFAKIETVNSEITAATGMTGPDASTLPEVFRGKINDGDAENVSVAFGQIEPNVGKTIKGYGIYLTKSNGDDVTTMKPGVGPKFPAESKSADNQFGIIFEQLKAGSYNAQTYIEYTDGSIVLGIKVPFTVAE